MDEKWYRHSLTETKKLLKVDFEQGLTSKVAESRLSSLGPNKLAEAKKESPLSIFIGQFSDFMVLVLIGTTVVSALLGEYVDAAAILAIVILNAILGFVQEYKAERSLDALKNLTAPVCKVIRDGCQQTIEASGLVPGDVVMLEAGDRVPADGRLLQASSLNVDEAALTGESIASDKNAKWVGEDDTALGDQKNMVFMGTLITRGWGEAVMVTTGMDTEIGKIAGMIQNSPKVETPLQRRLSQLGKWLVAACLGIVALVFVAGVMNGFPTYKMFMIGVTLGVAAIPEGLPAVVTIALAVGVQRMIRSNAIIRQLPAVETLGCATVICSDKTGTLTQNQMTVQEYWLNGQRVPAIEGKQLTKLAKINPELALSLRIGALCSRVQVNDRGKKLELLGDPTEVALVDASIRGGANLRHLHEEYKWQMEVPFDSERKRMSVCVRSAGQYLSVVKGAPDVIVERCTHIQVDEKVRPLGSGERQRILGSIEDMGGRALRVLGLAYRQLPSLPQAEAELEQSLIFVGLVGMIDPPRPEAKKAIRQAALAGIRTIMVTGDHKRTATAIAEQLGLAKSDAEVLTGAEWETLSKIEQQKAVHSVRVFARVAPQHKLSIVRALQSNGEIVGMTGDGVNDAPAVKEADIGISMGKTGTDVTKEASAMVLSDDNFRTIISAIREGRAIYENIRKFIRYLLACNVGEVLTMFFATLAGLPLPLLPIQILWMNLVTDGLPAIALGLDAPDEDIMERPPRPPKEGIFARRLHIKIGLTGLLISVCTLGVFVFSLWYFPEQIDRARTISFTTLVMAQLIFVFQCRSERHSIFEIGLTGNLFLVGAVFLSATMHVLIIYQPWLQQIFRTTALTLDDWSLVFVFSTWSLVLDTAIRIINRQVKRHLSLIKV